ncbi:sensor domain-containing diguanylate cyclase [Enterovirga rhinocerotis]|uniref:diguanylate cyclase n=1 Tax=Enterovirga rhinocerotis TaxID=1339210 RepID=A0A4R7C9T9_9HYPH|nr:diguanylate cyclase [Enterovirga rhinocerotis]TDR93537.1 diguanylate cyclase (GGDEF)-like protein [Enterovirga rhinocerotis]
MTAPDAYAAALDALDIAMAEYDVDLRVVRWNRTFERFFPEHAGVIEAGEPYADNLHRFYRARLDASDLLQIDRLVAEGVQRHLQQSAPFEFTHHGRVLRVASVPLPRGGRVRMWREAAHRERASKSEGPPAFDALDKIADGCCILDSNDRIIAANSRFRQLYDVADEEVIVGETLAGLVARSWGPASLSAALSAAIRNSLRYDSAPFLVELPGDRWRRVVNRHADQDHSYLVHSDVTASRRRERELQQLADRDSLTGLANRRAFDEAFAREREASLLLIDADHFKSVNDAFGHLVGDDCLRRIASILQIEAAAEGGLAARIGGEEFAVLLGVRPLAQVVVLAERIREAIHVSSTLPQLSVSIGVAMGPVAMLREDADRALYRAKTIGRNRVEVHDRLAKAS